MFNFEALSYRDNEGGLRLRRAELLAERRDELDALDDRIPRIYARRVARIAGGFVAIAGASLMVLAAALSRGAKSLFDHSLVDVPLTPILFVTMIAAPVVTILVRFLAEPYARRLAERGLLETDDVRADIERLDRGSPVSWIAQAADRLETTSVSAPLVGIALVAPLSLHLVVGFVTTAGANDLVDAFDWWILVSLIVVAPAHAMLAWQCVRFAKKLRAWRGEGTPPSPWAPYGWTVLAGFFPGVILFFVPPVLVAITGLVFVPATLGVFRRIVVGERFDLEVSAGST